MGPTRFNDVVNQLGNALTELQQFTFTANGNSPAYRVGMDLGYINAAMVSIGNLGGGTVTLQGSYDGSTWLTASTNTVSAANPTRLYQNLGIFEYLRMNLSGATSPNVIMQLVAPTGGGENVTFNN